MYGLVNQAIKDLVTDKFGTDKWNEICGVAKLDTTDFIAMNYYPDATTYALVGSASSVLKVPAEAVLELFGRHWVLYTAREGYGPMMDLFGGSYKECLMNLNNLHSRMGMTMPQLTPPKFEFTEVAFDEYELEYMSQRSGLCPMVSGLLAGLAEKHKIKVDLKYFEKDGRKLFNIKVKGEI